MLRSNDFDYSKAVRSFPAWCDNPKSLGRLLVSIFDYSKPPRSVQLQFSRVTISITVRQYEAS